MLFLCKFIHQIHDHLSRHSKIPFAITWLDFGYLIYPTNRKGDFVFYEVNSGFNLLNTKLCNITHKDEIVQ